MTTGDVRPELLEPLLDWLRIPSVSAGDPNPDALRAAAEWARDRVREAGGSCDLVETPGNPLVIGRFDAPTPAARTVLIYGHYDVQDPRPLDLWTTPPFEPTIRDGRVYARGASDDKGNFWPLLWAACEMAKAGELPVHVRVCVEGEEEQGSANTLRWLEAEPSLGDACIIYDSGNLGAGRPAITLGARGLVDAAITVRVGERDLHSGIYGGSVPNAIHELTRLLQHVLPGPDGLLRDELRAGRQSVPDAERAEWDAFPSGDTVIAAAGAKPLHETSGARYHEQNFWEPSLDVNHIAAGSRRTVIPAEATAFVTVRLAPGQRHAEIGAALDSIIQDAAPPHVEVGVHRTAGVNAASFDADHPVMLAARRAFERANGTEPQLIRLGGTLPLLEVLDARGVPTILTGFAGGRDNIHAPDESYRLDALEQGARSARALLEELATVR